MKPEEKIERLKILLEKAQKAAKVKKVEKPPVPEPVKVEQTGKDAIPERLRNLTFDDIALLKADNALSDEERRWFSTREFKFIYFQEAGPGSWMK